MRHLFVLLCLAFMSSGLFSQQDLRHDLGRNLRSNIQQQLTKDEAIRSLETLTSEPGLDLDSYLELVMKMMSENQLKMEGEVRTLFMGTEEKEGIYGFISRIEDKSITKMAFIVLVGGATSSNAAILTRYEAATINKGYESMGMKDGYLAVTSEPGMKKSFMERFNDFCLRMFGNMPQNKDIYQGKGYSPIKF